MLNGFALSELAIVAVVAASLLFVTVPAARICRRVGVEPWLGLFAAVPIANVVLLWYVAFAPWPQDRFTHMGR